MSPKCWRALRAEAGIFLHRDPKREIVRYNKLKANQTEKLMEVIQMTVSVVDAAVYLLEKKGQMSAMKLQKLLYYAQAWSLVWDDAPLFYEEIQAWANGPVIPDLFNRHKGRYCVNAHFFQKRGGDSAKLNGNQKDTIDRIIDFYGDKDSQWLSDLTHREAPWQNARQGLPDGVRGDVEITPVNMAEYYASLT